MLFSQDIDANEKDNSKEFLIAVKYEADLVIRGYVHFFILFRLNVDHTKYSGSRNHVRKIWSRTVLRQKAVCS